MDQSFEPSSKPPFERGAQVGVTTNAVIVVVTDVVDSVAVVVVVISVLVEPVVSLEHGFSMYLNTATILPAPNPV